MAVLFVSMESLCRGSTFPLERVLFFILRGGYLKRIKCKAMTCAAGGSAFHLQAVWVLFPPPWSSAARDTALSLGAVLLPGDSALDYRKWD